jgi:DNA replication and repair protein RecF
MHLQTLAISGFRNLADTVLSIDAPLVAFIGQNGQGKTNLLEAIGVLGLLKSFRTAKPQELVRWGENSAYVEARGLSEGLSRSWKWLFQGGERTLKRDDRTLDSATWLASLRACHFVPADTVMIRGEPALRRSLLDRAVFTVLPAHLGPVQVYRRLLAHKAVLLRDPNPDLLQLDVVDEQLMVSGRKIVAARAEVVERMLPAFSRLYREFSEEDQVSVFYRSSLGPALNEQQWREALALKRPEELKRARPLVGPHRDDLEFCISGKAARAYASQGQSRSLVLAWKLAEVEVAREQGETPLFLMDDLGSELDPDRTARLVGLLKELQAQIFLTTTDSRFIPGGGGSDARLYQVERGQIMV